MGICNGSAHLFAKLLKDKSFPEQPRVLTFGVQGIEGDYETVRSVLQREHYPVCAVPESSRQIDTLTEFGTSIHQTTFFNMLGFHTVDSLDYYPNEQPTFVADLNHPLPDNVTAYPYDLLYDGGTMEHCFNVPQVFENVLKLVKPGGYVIHANPLSGMVNHGFYQFSPTLFYDFYAANGFDQFELKILVEDRYLRCGGPEGTPQDFSWETVPGDFLGKWAVSFFMARKVADVAQMAFPIQNTYQQKFGQPASAGAASPGTTPSGKAGFQLQDLKAYIPSKRLLYGAMTIRKLLKLKARLKSF